MNNWTTTKESMNAYQWNQLIIWNEETNLNVRKFVATCDSCSQCQQQQKVQHSTLLLYYITHISIHTRTPRDATIILFWQQQRQQHHHHHPPPPHHDSGTCRSYINVVVVTIIVVVVVILLPHTSYGFIIDTNNKYGNVPEQRERVGAGTADER